MKYSLVLEQDTFNVVLHWNLLKGREKGKENTDHRSQHAKSEVNDLFRSRSHYQRQDTPGHRAENTQRGSPPGPTRTIPNWEITQKLFCFLFPPTLLYKSQYISARPSPIIQGDLSFRLYEFLCGCKSWAKERSNIQFKSAPHQFKIVSHSMLNVLSNSASNKIKAKGFKTTSDFRLLQSLIRFIGSE